MDRSSDNEPGRETPASAESDMREVWRRFVDEAERFTGGIRELPVAPTVAPAEVRAEIERRFGFDVPVPLSEVLAEVSGLLRRWTVHVTHPRYFGLFNPGVLDAGIVADALAALYNPQLAAWSHAPAAQEMERHVLRGLAGALGFAPDQVIANFTSGGAEANMSAVLAAIAHRFPETARAGVAALSAPASVYLTSEAHHSFVKIARMTGLGTDALREVPTTERFVMDPAALERMIREDTARGRHPLVVVATAGTTGGGLIDPLPEIRRVAADAGAWLHVDAAWGGAAALSPRLRPLLAGIERADSVTWDAHKWLSVPMGAGMFFCRHPDAVHRAFAVTTSYMPAASGGDTADPYAVTAQWSRRAIGLKVFMALAEIGLAGYAEVIERQTRMGDLLRERLADRGWIVVNDTRLPLVCFTHPDVRAGRVSTGDMLRTIYARGRVWISDVVLGGEERVLRACITSNRTDEADLDCLLSELERARAGA